MQRYAVVAVLGVLLLATACGRLGFDETEATDGGMDAAQDTDAGVENDAGTDAGPETDAGPDTDAGSVDDGGADDAGFDAGLADAGCGPACAFGDACELGTLDCSMGSIMCVSAGPAPVRAPCHAPFDCDDVEVCDGVSTSCPPHSAPCTTRLAFDGDDYVAVPVDPALAIASLTVEVFVYLPSSVPEMVALPVFSGGVVGVDRLRIYLQREGSDVRACFSGSTGSAGCRAPQPGWLDRWVHFAARVSGGNIELFRDGAVALVGSGTVTMNANDVRWGGSTPEAQHFIGWLSMGRFWTRALGAAELIALATGVSPTDRRGLHAEWRFDEGSGQTARDAAGSLHATLGATSAVESSDPTWLP